MKFANIHKFLSCRTPRGADVVAGAAIMGGASLIGSGVSAASASATSHASIRAQRDENQKNRDWQSDEAEKNRNWQSEEWTRQFDAQRDEWYKQLSAQYGAQWEQYVREQEYNSPQMQVQRAQEAGLNPGAVLGQNGGGLQAAPQAMPAQQPSVPTGGQVAGSQPSGGGMGPLPEKRNPFPADSLAGIGSFVSDMVSAARENVKLQPVLDDLISRARFQNASAYSQEVAAAGVELDNTLKKLKLPASVAQEYKQLQLMDAQIQLDMAMGKKVDAETFLVKAQEALAKANEHLATEQATLVTLQGANYIRLVNAQIDAYNAGATRDRAAATESLSQADYNKALTMTEDAMRDGNVEHLKLSNQLVKGNIEYSGVQTKIANGELVLQDAAITQQELSSLRDRDIIERRGNSWIFRNTDGALHWILGHASKVLNIGINFSHSSSKSNSKVDVKSETRKIE